jgi:hypothetical protein
VLVHRGAQYLILYLGEEKAMLSELRLEELPLDVLVLLQEAITSEMARRTLPAQLHLIDGKSTGYVESNAPLPSYEQWVGQKSQRPFALPPMMRRTPLQKRLSFLPYILTQDWGRYFPDAENTREECYVYAHLDPRTQPLHLPDLHVVLKGTPFYIGKGIGQRAYDLKRNQGHGKRIQQLQQLGYAPTTFVQIVTDLITERQALSLEAQLIYFFGSIYDETVAGCLLNLADHVRPRHVLKMRELPTRKAYEKVMARIPKDDRLSREAHARWESWQQSTVSRARLAQEDRQQGYTVVQIMPPAREAFLDLLPLLRLYGRVGAWRAVPLEVLEVWHEWHQWTRRITGYLRRLEQKQSGTRPANPFDIVTPSRL